MISFSPKSTAKSTTNNGKKCNLEKVPFLDKLGSKWSHGTSGWADIEEYESWQKKESIREPGPKCCSWVVERQWRFLDPKMCLENSMTIVPTQVWKQCDCILFYAFNLCMQVWYSGCLVKSLIYSKFGRIRLWPIRWNSSEIGPIECPVFPWCRCPMIAFWPIRWPILSGDLRWDYIRTHTVIFVQWGRDPIFLLIKKPRRSFSESEV